MSFERDKSIKTQIDKTLTTKNIFSSIKKKIKHYQK